MKKEWADIISENMGVESFYINSNLFSAQNRPRLYWTNINFDKNIQDKNIFAESIKDMQDEYKSSTLCYVKGKKYILFNGNKLGCLTTQLPNVNGIGRPCWSKEEFLITKPFDYSKIRQISPQEAEKAQTISVGYTSILSNCQRYKVLGNCWTVDVIAHIFKGLISEV